MEPGDTTADFTLPDAQGTSQSLSTLLADGPVVLFFYPKAGTSGCTAEACHFRDLAAEFTAAGAQRVGISNDPVDKLAEFAAEHDFDYPLLSDTDGTVAEQFDARRALGMPFKRRTFVLDTDGTVLAAYDDERNMEAHADRALEVLNQQRP